MENEKRFDGMTNDELKNDNVLEDDGLKDNENEKGSNDEKVFTQEEVNKIVKSRLEREKSNYEELVAKLKGSLNKDEEATEEEEEKEEAEEEKTEDKSEEVKEDSTTDESEEDKEEVNEDIEKLKRENSLLKLGVSADNLKYVEALLDVVDGEDLKTKVDAINNKFFNQGEKEKSFKIGSRSKDGEIDSELLALEKQIFKSAGLRK